MNRLLLVALVLLVLAAAWTAMHPSERWDLFPRPIPVQVDELMRMNPD